jgi:hypothetical protein
MKKEGTQLVGPRRLPNSSSLPLSFDFQDRLHLRNSNGQEVLLLSFFPRTKEITPKRKPP